MTKRTRVFLGDRDVSDVGRRPAEVHRFAIADPEHAPYGRPRARRFSGWGLLDEMRERMVLGENVPQAPQYVASGSAQAGITALSLARSNAAPALARSCWRW